MAKRPVSGTLHARLREVEPGVFSAEYPGELNPAEGGPQTYPDTHVGTDPAGVRSWVEQMARGLGYDRVEWETG
ncbi:MAG TPA: hypothetical protein VE690_04150 [Rhodopila sp.]|jgi:hypothetical protein|nr:hypothetical protein [Rhodopila sp.]